MPELMAALSCWGYGYSLKVRINGGDVGVAGGKSENRRLFNADHEMAAQAAPEMRKKNFVLKEGPNSISVEFTRQPAADPHDRLEISLEMENYPAPLFHLVTRKAAGKVEESVAIHDQPPADFKPLEIAD